MFRGSLEEEQRRGRRPLWRVGKTTFFQIKYVFCSVFRYFGEKAILWARGGVTKVTSLVFLTKSIVVRMDGGHPTRRRRRKGLRRGGFTGTASAAGLSDFDIWMFRVLDALILIQSISVVSFPASNLRGVVVCGGQKVNPGVLM